MTRRKRGLLNIKKILSVQEFPEPALSEARKMLGGT